MKTIHLLSVLILITFSCSKSNDETPPNNDLVFENLNQVNIPEKVNGQAPTPVNSEINVG